MKSVEWLLDCAPREVQLEALRRSFYGHKLKTGRDSLEKYVDIRDGRPAKKWGHFLEMRLGKTPTALNEWLLFQQKYGVNRLVVFTPNTYKATWVKEFAKFGVEHPAFALEMGNKAQKEVDAACRSSTPIAMIVNYEATQHKHGAEFVKQFMAGHKTGFIFDESIKLKNPNSIQTTRCRDLAKDADYIRPMSGRPMTQGPTDLYTQLRLCGLYEGKNFYAFRNKYCVMGGFKNRQIRGTQNEEELAAIMSQGSFLAKRIDWADIIESQYMVEELSMSPEQQSHYDTMAKDFYVMLEEETIDVGQVITQYMKLQQISSGFIYDEHKNERWLVDPKRIPKMTRLLQIMEETTSKVVVCFHYRPSGGQLLKQLEKYCPSVILGKQGMKELGRDYDTEKQRFNNDPSSRVMLAQLDAVKYGHDLTGAPGDRTHLMFMYENTLSLDTRGQVEARITASTQDWEISYMDTVSSEIESKFIQGLIRKESMEELVLGSFGKKRWA